MNKNIVAEANAGTGKTTFGKKQIISRILKRELRPDRLLAITFTEKMASELKKSIVDDLLRISSNEVVEYLKHEWQNYKDPANDAFNAITEIQRGYIGTIHSFCSMVLSSYPDLCQVPPNLRVDEAGQELDAIFDSEFKKWVQQNRQRLSEFLTLISLRDLQRLCQALVDFRIPDEYFFNPQDFALNNNSSSDIKTHIQRLLEGVFSSQGARTRKIPEDIRRIQLVECWYPDNPQDILEWKQHIRRISTIKQVIDRGEVKKQVRNICNIATVNEHLVYRLLKLVADLILRIRRQFIQKGFVTFDYMISHVLHCVRNNFKLREILKKRYDLIFVDEFQDTDAYQFELILFLSEDDNSYTTSVNQIKLKPGKLVIAGDPKQSIYSFRGADLKAYAYIRDKILEDGVLEQLNDNWRSCKELVQITNNFADLLFNKTLVETPTGSRTFKDEYKITTIESRSSSDIIGAAPCFVVYNVANTDKLSLSQVVARKIVSEIWDLQKNGVSLSSIGILMRKLTNAYLYAEVFNEAGINLWIGGGRSFYQQPEVLEFYNILEAISSPVDAAALVGVVRGPLCLAPMEKIIAPAIEGLTPDRWIDNLNAHHLEFCRPVLEFIKQARQMRHQPAADVIHHIFTQTDFLSRISQTGRGELALANINKLYRQAIASRVSLREYVRALRNRIKKPGDFGEEEEPIADEKLDAVRLLTFHKAKGLQFDYVIIPEITTQVSRDIGRYNRVLVSWIKGEIKIGLQSRRFRDLTSIEIENQQEPEDFEEMRLLYVALTRARKKLIIIDDFSRRYKSELGKYFERCIGELGIKAEPVDCKKIEEDYLNTINSIQAGKEVKPCQVYKTVEEIRDKISIKPFVVTHPHKLARPPEVVSVREYGKEIGDVCHYVLQNLDFNNPEIKNLCEQAIWRLSQEEPQLTLDRLEKIRDTSYHILERFIESEVFQDISKKVKYREVPVWAKCDGEIIEARVDLMWEEDGVVIVADYKTDEVLGPQQLIDAYGDQLRAYARAIKAVTGKSTRAFIISLHLLCIVEVV